MLSDFSDDFRKLNIRDEVSKTFGRKINLMVCHDLIKDYVKNKGLKEDDYVFDINPSVVNRYLKRIVLKIFGDQKTDAGGKYSELTMYDFRHSSACYWLPRYKSESALKYRFGWKKSEMIHYYTEFLGMKDTIMEDDMLIDVTKTEIEKRLEVSEQEKYLLQEKMFAMESQLAIVQKVTKELYAKLGKTF